MMMMMMMTMTMMVMMLMMMMKFFDLTERCNETLRPSEIKAHDVTVRLRATEGSPKDAEAAASTPPSIYCWTRFEGTGNQFIEVTVKELRLGQNRSLQKNQLTL